MNPNLALIDLRSAYNVGSLLRTADSVGVDTVYFSGITPNPDHPKVQKTALTPKINWLHLCDPIHLIAYLKSLNLTCIGLETPPHFPSLYQNPLPPNCCFFLGNEVSGLTLPVLKHLDNVYSLPQYGQKESLNVGVAGGIALYEFRRQYPRS